MKRWILTAIAVLVTVLALGATAFAVGLHVSGDAPPGPMMSRGSGVGPMMGGRADGRHGWMAGGMRGWMHGARVSSERKWLTVMVAHHEEAVSVARELARSDRPELRDFGEQVVAAQSAQIEQMNGWLEEWYGGPAAGVDYRPMMRDLSGLTGDRLDRVFLQDMVRHHMAAVMMSQQLLVSGLAEHPQVADLARQIRDQQHREIFQMQEWLADWFGGGGWHMGPGRGPGMMRGWR